MARAHRLEGRQKVKRFQTEEDVMEFFERCRLLDGSENEPERELDWEEHLKVINESKLQAVAKMEL